MTALRKRRDKTFMHKSKYYAVKKPDSQKVGDSVGDSVGDNVGLSVGDNVGLSVGSSTNVGAARLGYHKSIVM